MSTALPLPPGKMGLPYYGEALAFLKSPFQFIAERRQRLGPVFKSRVLGRNIVFLSGLDGAEAFFDDANITREDAHPWPLVQLFGGINLEMYDGPRHVALKMMAVSAFDQAAIVGYLPDIQRLIEARLDSHAGGPAFSATAELRRLVMEIICANVLGLEPGPETGPLVADYAKVLLGLKTIPYALPGMPYRAAIRARDRVLKRLREVIAERRRKPGGEALSQILQATAANGHRYSDEEALLEMQHIVIAGFIVFSVLAEIMRRLAEMPELKAACAEEVQAAAPAGPLTMAALQRMPTCLTIVMEAKRIVPLVPLAFGRARRTFTCGGHTVPEGWTVWLALSVNNLDPSIFARPNTFEPARFTAGRAEHQHHRYAFIPQGVDPPEGHRCLGLDYSTFISLAFLSVLVGGYEWELPVQRFDTDWRKLPPEPADGLQVVLRRKAAAPAANASTLPAGAARQ